MCQGSYHFSGFLHDFVLAKLVTSSIRGALGAESLGYNIASTPLLGCVITGVTFTGEEADKGSSPRTCKKHVFPRTQTYCNFSALLLYTGS